MLLFQLLGMNDFLNHPPSHPQNLIAVGAIAVHYRKNAVIHAE